MKLLKRISRFFHVCNYQMRPTCNWPVDDIRNGRNEIGYGPESYVTMIYGECKCGKAVRHFPTLGITLYGKAFKRDSTMEYQPLNNIKPCLPS